MLNEMKYLINLSNTRKSEWDKIQQHKKPKYKRTKWQNDLKEKSNFSKD